MLREKYGRGADKALMGWGQAIVACGIGARGGEGAAKSMQRQRRFVDFQVVSSNNLKPGDYDVHHAQQQL